MYDDSEIYEIHQYSSGESLVIYDVTDIATTPFEIDDKKGCIRFEKDEDTRHYVRRVKIEK